MSRTRLVALLVLLALAMVFLVPSLSSKAHSRATSATATNATKIGVKPPAASSPGTTPSAATPKTVATCQQPTTAKYLVVSISLRHLWACSGTNISYNSPVITGIASLAADLTPTGTYTIYGKQTNLYLTGSDSTGSWNDYVHFWMPFLDNRYGVYGLHDATWRPSTAFGTISPDSPNASHGCVELPLTTASWIYGWAAVGTTITIES